jgi:hypothetical protein
MFADGMRLGEDCAPVWRRVPGRWPAGCVDTLTTAARKYYYSPHVWAPDQDCAFFNHSATRERWGVAGQAALSRDQSIAWLTGAALTGGVVKIGDRFSTLSNDEVSVLQKLLPVLPQSARPIDLFDNEHPQIWVLPVSSRVGSWTLVAVFNWDDTQPARIPLSVGRLGLNTQHSYAAYDFWEEKYYGVVEGQVAVVVPPAAVRLLCLRRYTGAPMFLSTDRHFSQGATDFTSLEWDEAARELRGAFDAVEDTEYNLRVLVPEPYSPKRVEVSCGRANVSTEGAVLRIAFHCASAGSVAWSARF